MVGNFPAEAHSLRAYAVRRVMAAGDYFTASIMDLKNAIPPPVAEHPFPWLMVFSVAATILYVAADLIYQRWYSPLHRTPGPWWAGSSLPYCKMLSDGTFNNKVRELHEKYGDVVRVAPKEVSFINGEVAWDEIYGFRAGPKKSGTFLKDKNWIARTEPPSMIVADGADHTRFRRLLAHAFSNVALKDQEPLIQRQVDLFINGIKEEAALQAGVVNFVKWFNFFTFDVIADLTFGQSFGCLTKKDERYVNMVNSMLQAGAQGRVKHMWPTLGTLGVLLGLQVVPMSALKMIPEFLKFARNAVQTRLDSQVDRPDFISYILRYNGQEGKGMTHEEIDSNCVQFLIAGSETSATTLSGLIYLLALHPKYLNQLTKEIRGRFSGPKEMTFQALEDIQLLNATISETLRLYPPVPTGFPRISPPGGATIGNYFLPENTAVYVSQYAANHSPRNFVDPDAFCPERWMGDAHFDKDNKKTHQPFSFGPRVCIGKNLAHAEMRLAVARLLYEFDLELQTSNWLDQKVWVSWNKGPLSIKLRQVLE